MPKQKTPRKNCPYSVRITCNLTPPFDFIRETHHTSRETAMKAIGKAKREFKGTPGLRIDLRTPKRGLPKTSWQRILAV